MVAASAADAVPQTLLVSLVAARPDASALLIRQNSLQLLPGETWASFESAQCMQSAGSGTQS